MPKKVRRKGTVGLAAGKDRQQFYDLPNPPRPRKLVKIVSTENLDLGLELCATQKPDFTSDTIFHVGVSGGKDSVGALLWMIHESGVPKSQIVASFCDIGNDHEWTIAHVKLISETVHPIETIRPEMDFFELALHKRRFPSTKVRFCTEHLKIFPTQDHIQSLKLGGFKVIAISGTRAEESEDRSELSEWDYSPDLFCYHWRPLIKWTVKEVYAIHEKYGVPLNPLYAIGAQRVGCWPCIMSRKSEIRIIALKFPERITEIRNAELEFEKRYGRFSSFFPIGAVPDRFCSREAWSKKKGKMVKFPTIDDVVRWSMSGEGAKGSYLDDAPVKEKACKVGFCE